MLIISCCGNISGQNGKILIFHLWGKIPVISRNFRQRKSLNGHNIMTMEGTCWCLMSLYGDEEDKDKEGYYDL